MQSFVVVWDPDGTLPEGKVLISDERYFAARRRGVVMLPVLGEPCKISLAPWSMQFFGDGEPTSEVVPAYVGKGALWLEAGHGGVSWAAMLRHPAGMPCSGLLRLVGSPHQAPIAQAPAGDDPRNHASLGRAEHEGETHVVVAGQVACQVMSAGIYAFALHGYARDCRLAWLALAQFP
jgi:hypothetical protein